MSQVNNGTGAWSISGSGSGAVATGFFGSVTTNDLQLAQFGFAIPSTATITGISVSITRQSADGSNTPTATDNDVTLLKNGVPTGNNEATGAPWPSTAAAVTYGSSSDLWGANWTPDDINNPGFGVQVSANANGGLSGTGISTFAVTITVSYLE
jgi:hypothetical protein